MKPVEFPEANTTLFPPSGKTENCGTLPVYREGVQMISCWTLSEEELQEITRTGRLWLLVQSTAHPPVGMTPYDPFHPRQEKKATAP